MMYLADAVNDLLVAFSYVPVMADMAAGALVTSLSNTLQMLLH